MTQETLSGVRVVRAYGQEAASKWSGSGAPTRITCAGTRACPRAIAILPDHGLLMGIGALLVLWLGSREVVAAA